MKLLARLPLASSCSILLFARSGRAQASDYVSRKPCDNKEQIPESWHPFHSFFQWEKGTEGLSRIDSLSLALID